MGLFVMFLFGIALLINVEFAHKKTGSDLEKSLSEPVLLNFFNVLLLSWKFSTNTFSSRKKRGRMNRPLNITTYALAFFDHCLANVWKPSIARMIASTAIASANTSWK